MTEQDAAPSDPRPATNTPDGNPERPRGFRISRRQALAAAGGAIAGGAAVAAAILPGRHNDQGPTPPADGAGARVPTAAVADPGGGLPLPTALAADASPEFRAVAEALVDAMRTNRIPGTALGILSGDHEEHATFGVASANTLMPVGANTLFQIGSLTKTYTATMIWRLIEQGAVAADAPVRTYLPDLRLMDEATASAVTINHLLDHSGGWYGDELIYTGENDDAIARFVAEQMPRMPQNFPLGKFFSYNNAGFALLGRVIEAVTGTTYTAALDDMLLGPLGLTDTLLDRSKILQRDYSDGHCAGPINGTDGVAVQTPLWIPRSADPAGGIWSTTRDVLRYARMHLGDAIDGEPALLSPETLQRMQAPAKSIPGLPLSIGRNWFVQDVGGMRTIFHNGDTAGQHTVFIAIPEQRFALALLTNSLSGGVPAELATIDAALNHYSGLTPLAGKVGLSRAIVVPKDEPTVTLPAGELADYTGLFANPESTFTFTARDDELSLLFEPIVVPNAFQPAIGPPPSEAPVPLGFVARDSGVLNGGLLPFVRDDAGRIGWISAGLRLVPRANPN